MAYNKTELNDFCQSNRIPVHGYETRRVGDGFVSVLKCDKYIFESSKSFPTKKEAENDVAVIALNALKARPPSRGQEPPSPPKVETPVANSTLVNSTNVIDPRSGQSSSPNHYPLTAVPYTAVPCNVNGGIHVQQQQRDHVLHVLTHYCFLHNIRLLHKVRDLGKGRYCAEVAVGGRQFIDPSVHSSFDDAKHSVNLLAMKELNVEGFLRHYYEQQRLVRPVMGPPYAVPPYVRPYRLLPTNNVLMYHQVPVQQVPVQPSPINHSPTLPATTTHTATTHQTVSTTSDYDTTTQLTNMSLDVARQPPLVTTPPETLISRNTVTTSSSSTQLMSPAAFSNSVPPGLHTRPTPSPPTHSAMSLPTRNNIKKDHKIISPQSTNSDHITASSSIVTSPPPPPSFHPSPSLTSPSLPVSSLPTGSSIDEPTEVSYKAILNEYALKQKMTLPSYTAEYPDNCVGYIGIVEFGGKTYKSPPDKNKKKALNLAAKEVLVTLGHCLADKPHPVTTPTQSISYKNQLQEYYQKRKLPLPQYITCQTPSGKFTCTITCHVNGNERTFKGSECTTKKVAEQMTAQEVCKVLKI